MSFIHSNAELTASIVSLLSGETTVEELAEARGVDAARVEEWRELYLAGLRESTRVSPRSRSKSSRAASRLGALAAVGVLLLAGFGIMAADGDCPNNLPHCFYHTTPAKASQVNENFDQLLEWLETKVGVRTDHRVLIDQATDVADDGGSVTGGGLVLTQGTYEMYLDGNEIESAGGELLLNAVKRNAVRSYGDLEAQQALIVAGATTLNTLDVSGTTTLDGELTANAAATFNSTLDIENADDVNATGGGGLRIDDGGNTMRLDGNEIDSTSNLNLNIANDNPVIIGADLQANSNSRSGCNWEGWISEEDGSGGNICNDGKYAAGIACSGSYCDSVRLYCCEL